MHLLLDHDGYLPTFAHISEGREHEIQMAHTLKLAWRALKPGKGVESREKGSMLNATLKKPTPRRKHRGIYGFLPFGTGCRPTGCVFETEGARDTFSGRYYSRSVSAMDGNFWFFCIMTNPVLLFPGTPRGNLSEDTEEMKKSDVDLRGR